MKIRIMIMMICVLAFTSAAFAQKGKNGNGGTAVPAGTVTFDGGSCTAKFVRSASGLINETNRNCSFFGYDNVKIQFRPLNGTPNPNCDEEGLLVQPFTFTNSEASLAPYFGTTQAYNVCAYQASPAATGNLTFDNGGYTATVKFTAANITSMDPLAAQGTLTYSDSRITYTTNVKYVKVVGNTTYLVGQVTSVNGQPICCSLGNYIFYKVVDNAATSTPDQISGADLGAITDAQARDFVANMYSPPSPNPFTITSGNITVY